MAFERLITERKLMKKACDELGFETLSLCMASGSDTFVVYSPGQMAS